MKAYLDLVRTILDQGEHKPSRTGVDTISHFAAFYSVDLADGFPLLTTKRVNFDAVLRELLWYLSGENHIRNLRRHTKIWNDWADADGNLETAYGHYWRHFPSATRAADGAWHVREVDQIQYVIDTIKREPSSRRLVVSAWEPGNATTSRLPPCHYTFAFHVSGGRLNCHLTQRSGDVALGIPFNLAAYSCLTMMMAQECGLEPGRFAHSIVDAHAYAAAPGSAMSEYDHVRGLREQLTREPLPLPRLRIAKKPFGALAFEDFELTDYQCHEPIRFKVAV